MQECPYYQVTQDAETRVLIVTRLETLILHDSLPHQRRPSPLLGGRPPTRQGAAISGAAAQERDPVPVPPRELPRGAESRVPGPVTGEVWPARASGLLG